MEQKPQIIDIKDNFVHELKRNRMSKGLTQEEMAKLVKVSKRTYQRLEDKKDTECAFSASMSNLFTYSEASSYEFFDWIIKICNPKRLNLERSLYKWELDVLGALKIINQNIRRGFSKKIETCNHSKLEMIIFIASMLVSMKERNVSNLMLYLIGESENEDLPDDLLRKFIKNVYKK